MNLVSSENTYFAVSTLEFNEGQEHTKSKYSRMVIKHHLHILKLDHDHDHHGHHHHRLHHLHHQYHELPRSLKSVVMMMNLLMNDIHVTMCIKKCKYVYYSMSIRNAIYTCVSLCICTLTFYHYPCIQNWTHSATKKRLLSAAVLHPVVHQCVIQVVTNNLASARTAHW